jgi:sRNA-binding carbon storage regulator CsrA
MLDSVVIGGADGFHRLLKVTVLAINGGRVRLGFEADVGLPVHREEVWERMGAKIRPSEGGQDH